MEAGDIERGSYLIVESLDRLSRTAVLDAASQLFKLIQAGIIVVTLSDKQEYSQDRLRADWHPLIVSLAVMARAHDESRIKGMRVGAAWSEKRRRAADQRQAMTAACPAWVTLVGGPRTGHYEIVQERAEIVRSIFRDTIDGMGRRTIANALNSAGVPTWGAGKKRGSRWHNSYIQKILGNPSVFGQYQPLSKLAGGNGTTSVPAIADYFPPVVDEATFYAAQAASRSRGSGKGRTSDEFRNILSGLVKCAVCDGTMVFIDKGKRSSGPKLICGAAHARAGCSHRVYHSYYEIEGRVLQYIADEHLQALTEKDSDEVTDMRSQIATETAKCAVLVAELGNLIDLVAVSGGAAAVADKVRDLDRKVAQSTATIETLSADLQRVLATRRPTRSALDALFARVYSEDDMERRRARAQAAQELRYVIDSVDVLEDGDFTVFLSTGKSYT